MILIGIVSLGFAARLITALRADLHPDETYDLFAARMIWEHGIPIFPSGMLWTTGGPLTYLEAPFVALFGDVSRWARLPSVLLATASIWLLYRLGKQTLGGAAATGAALAWALDPDAVLWGAYARQYSLHPLALFATLLLLRETARREVAGYCGVAAAAAFTVTAWAQPPSLLFLPGLAASFVLWMRPFKLRRALVAATCGTLASMAVMALVNFGDPGLMQSAAAQGGAIVVPPLTVAGIEAEMWRYVPFLTTFPHRALLLVLMLLALGMAAVAATPLASGPDGLSARQRDILALGVFALLSFCALGFLRYQQPGYGLALLGPVFLLGASTLADLEFGLRHSGEESATKSSKTAAHIMIFPVLLVVGLLLIPVFPALRQNSGRGTGDGQIQAYAFVGEHWRPGDAMLNANITAWVYAGRDPHFYYLCVDSCGLGLTKTNHGYVNRFLGSPQIRTHEEVERILGQYPRVWFVIKQADWENDERFPPAIRQLISDRMDIVFHRNLATVFLSRDR